MNYPQQILALDPSAWPQYQAFLEAASKPPPAGSVAPAPQPPTLEISGDCGLLPLRGIVQHAPSEWEKMCGAFSCKDGADLLDQAIASTVVKWIFMDIDSPGGSLQGTAEYASKVAAANQVKPIVAFSSGMLASAAFWIASGAGWICVTPTAVCPSVGVITAYLDATGALAQFGLKYEVLKSGPLKAIGAFGQPLDQAQRDHATGGLVDAFELFTGHLASVRPGCISETVLSGGTWMGHKAKRLGVVDEVVLDLAAALRSGPRPGARQQQRNMQTMSASDFGAQYDASPAIRDEFLSRSSYVAFMAGLASGRIRTHSNFLPDDGATATAAAAATALSAGEDAQTWQESSATAAGARYDASPAIRDEFLSKTSYIKYCEGLRDGRIVAHDSGATITNFAPREIAASILPGFGSDVRRGDFETDESFELWKKAKASGRIR